MEDDMDGIAFAAIETPLRGCAAIEELVEVLA